PVESGQRLFSQNVETSQFAAGFKGYFNLGGNEWDWDVNYVYGNNYSTTLTTGLFNTERLATALDSPGVASCASQSNCVPFNIFGGNGSITPAMLNYVLYEDHSIVAVNQRDYTANLNGSLADLPAGPLGFAFGAEYLEQDGFSHPDATTSTGNTSGSVTQPTDGRTKTNAEYVEFDFPLVADAPGFKMLDLDVANRWSQFKWFGGAPGQPGSTTVHTANASTARAALKWQPLDTLLVRASWSQGFRAPSVSDLFFGHSDSFPTVNDPCAVNPTPAGCPSHHTQPNAQIKTTIGGNPLLEPEKALSRSIGFVYNPEFLPGFDFSADYYKIELNNQITAIAPQTILNSCYLANNTANCGKITVNGGIITNILDTNVNIGGTRTSGVDVSTHYKLPSTSVGDFKVGLDWTFLKSFMITIPTGNALPLPQFSSTELAGTTTSFGGFPRQKANASLTWNYGDWSASWMVQYIGAMYEGCTARTLATYTSQCSDPTGFYLPTGGTGRNHVGATTYHDVQAMFHADAINTDFTFGIRNLFDKNPPAVLTAFANSFLPAFYRVPGREFYGRISVKF
ncbi:MAG TPA: TonB-dependent receptor, partial [Gammaproteobacteria bacterium]|nr:TonB-dependent receptor [Gammaproteobacteria bacterium]